MPLRIDFHCHTWFSSDSATPPELLLENARKRGLHGIVITDHDSCLAIQYLQERQLVRADGMPVDGFLVIPGVEVSTADGHVLCIGVTLSNQWKGRPAIEVCHAIHEAGGLAIVSHPFDAMRSGVSRVIVDELPIDALEVFNASSSSSRNRAAYEYAAQRNLPMVASSDSHVPSTIGISHTILLTEDLSTQGVLKQITQKNELQQQQAPLWCSVVKPLQVGWRLLRGRDPAGFE